MRLPRVRFTVRRMMVAVAVVALILLVMVQIIEAQRRFSDRYFPRPGKAQRGGAEGVPLAHVGPPAVIRKA